MCVLDVSLFHHQSSTSLVESRHLTVCVKFLCSRVTLVFFYTWYACFVRILGRACPTLAVKEYLRVSKPSLSTFGLLVSSWNKYVMHIPEVVLKCRVTSSALTKSSGATQ